MNRWTARCTRSMALALAAFVVSLAAFAQNGRTFPPEALRGDLVVTGAPPAVKLDGRDDRLSPGARIRGIHNTLVVPASLVGQPLVVNYTRNAAGMIHEVWILTELEAAQPRASGKPPTNFVFESQLDKPPGDDGKTPFNQLPRYRK